MAQRRDAGDPRHRAPHGQGAAVEVARWCRKAPSPASTTTATLAMRTAFQALLSEAKWKVEMFQNPVMIRTT